MDQARIAVYHLTTHPCRDGKIIQALDFEHGLLRDRIVTEIVDTREEHVRAALVELGWTPPGSIPPGMLIRQDWTSEVREEMARARSLHPDPALLTTAFAEEAGEVVKAICDHMAGKGSLYDVRKELIQAAAMAGRLLEEGDPVHRLNPPIFAANTEPKKNG